MARPHCRSVLSEPLGPPPKGDSLEFATAVAGGVTQIHAHAHPDLSEHMEVAGGVRCTDTHAHPDSHSVHAVHPAGTQVGDAPSDLRGDTAWVLAHGEEQKEAEELEQLSQRKPVQFARAQAEDITIKPVYDHVRAHGHHGAPGHKYDYFVLVQAVLYYLHTVKHGGGSLTHRRLVLPEVYRSKVLYEFHTSNLTDSLRIVACSTLTMFTLQVTLIQSLTQHCRFHCCNLP